MSSGLDSVATELSALRAELELSPDPARARVCARLASSIPELVAVSAGAAAASKSLPPGSHLGRIPALGKLWLVGTFALGGAVGAGTYAALDRKPEARVVYVDRVVATAQENVPSAAAPAAPAAEPDRVATDVSPGASRGARVNTSPQRLATSAGAPAETRPSEPTTILPNLASLGEQQALLDRARLALTKQSPAAALEMLDLHGQRFPESVLREEREALTIKALAAIGKHPEARARFELFRQRFSRSPLLPSLEASTKRAVTEAKR